MAASLNSFFRHGTGRTQEKIDTKIRPSGSKVPEGDQIVVCRFDYPADYYLLILQRKRWGKSSKY